MIITYLRSSSYNAFDFCQFKYFCDYNLAYHSPAGKKAIMGTISHKALELLAKAKLAKQNKQESVVDDYGIFKTAGLIPNVAIEVAYHNITIAEKKHTWLQTDFNNCKKYMLAALEWKNGMFSPLKRDVICPEKYFDITIKQPWAKYNYKLPSGETISGSLSIKGTLDLIVRHGDGIELIDWKTGMRKDWNKDGDEKKTYEDMMDDPQLLLYHYALCNLYPAVENIFVTIFYLQDGGPYSLCFQKKNLFQTELLLRKRFEQIKNTTVPDRLWKNGTPHWKCKYLCHFYKHDVDNQPVTDEKRCACNVIYNELLQVGLDKVVDKYCKDKSFTSYGEGGGTTRK